METSGPVQACNGIALPLSLSYEKYDQQVYIHTSKFIILQRVSSPRVPATIGCRNT